MSSTESRKTEGKRSYTYSPLEEQGGSAEEHFYSRAGEGTSNFSILRLIPHLLSFGAGVLLTALFFFSGASHNNSSDANTKIASSAPLLSPVPQIPSNIVTFDQNETFSARPSILTNHAWNTLLPPGRGYVFVRNPRQYNLEPGEETKHGQIYSVSMFHQLHCLGQIRKAHWTLIEGVETGEMRPSKKLVGEGGAHIGHCLDYLRQGIMCAGDMSLEWPRTEPNGDRYAVDGWGVPHQCKSWDAIWDYMSEAHFNSSMNAQIAPD